METKLIKLLNKECGISFCKSDYVFWGTLTRNKEKDLWTLQVINNEKFIISFKPENINKLWRLIKREVK
ncbi:hypothetical protein [[Mycoplasma] anseris]|uniref:Uncharacterized protein n=1 Tax=[Mycoplasma] anseris TaxID=92400 RepID=A0A2Z4NDM8_9BACT|nr:hypothetical protein [[Mycoplasma] anseris]AWX69691.1 hypothetical protein DP065_02970 [[Mycoplasma] anseris]